jgi:hypothetical protein
VATYGEWSEAAREILRVRPETQRLINEVQSPPANQEMGYFVATDRDGYPVAFSLAALFGGTAVLIWSLSVPGHPAASAARYLVQSVMRSDLRGRGVRHLICGSAIRESPGLQYFQFLLGYEVRNLHITVRDTRVAPPLRLRSPAWPVVPAGLDPILLAPARRNSLTGLGPLF